jgi:hypothetical protein
MGNVPKTVRKPGNSGSEKQLWLLILGIVKEERGGMMDQRKFIVRPENQSC